MGEKLSQKAFSLVELMVTIGIIALVAAAALGSVSAIQKSSRDTQRKADLNTIKSALQQYYANENHFPDSLVLTAGTPINNCTGLTGCTVNRTYLGTTPKDPTGVTAYYYCSQTSVTNTAACSGGTSGQCHYYALCATLENPSSITSCTCGGTTSGNVILSPL